MRLLVTGGAGFIGSSVVDLLVKEGYEVAVVDNLSTGRRENVNDGASFYSADITDSKGLEEIFRKEDFSAVVHQAAQASVRRSIEEPAFDASTNIMGSLELLELSRKYAIEKFIFASTGGAIYGEPEYLPVDEEHSIAPLSPYGVAKYAVENYMHIYQSLYGIQATALRYGNVYGPRQDPYGEAGVIAIFASKIARGKRPEIFGDGEQTRDFVYAGDVARANVLALEGSVSEPINIASGVETSVNQIAEMLIEALDSEVDPLYCKELEGEVRHICLDITRARKTLGWEPAVSLREGIKRYVAESYG